MDLLRCEHGLQMRMLPTLLDQAQGVQPAQATRSGKRLRQFRLLPVIQEHMQVEPLLLTPQVAHRQGRCCRQERSQSCRRCASERCERQRRVAGAAAVSAARCSTS